jgi:hypothetical protein
VTTFVKTEVRASEVARGCDRMSVGRALGWESGEPDDEQKEWFSRGHLFEWYYGKQLDAKHGPENIVRQPSFEHPLGVGHSDFLIVPERLLVEVKSTQAGTLSTPVFDNGVEQLRIAIHFHPDAGKGALVMLNPSTLRAAEVYEVVNTPEDDDRIEEMFARIAAHIEAETLPERVCHKPGNARGMLCPFAVTCFEGWEEPQPYEVTDPEAVRLAALITTIQMKERLATAEVKGLEEQKKEAKRHLSEFLPEKGESVVGPFAVQTWPVKGQVKVNAKALAAAGIDPAPFSTKGNDRVEVRVSLAEEAGDVEYGSVPF